MRKIMPLVLALAAIATFAVPALADCDGGGGTCPIHHGGGQGGK